MHTLTHIIIHINTQNNGICVAKLFVLLFFFFKIRMDTEVRDLDFDFELYFFCKNNTHTCHLLTLPSFIEIDQLKL